MDGALGPGAGRRWLPHYVRASRAQRCSPLGSRRGMARVHRPARGLSRRNARRTVAHFGGARRRSRHDAALGVPRPREPAAHRVGAGAGAQRHECDRRRPRRGREVRRQAARSSRRRSSTRSRARTARGRTTLPSRRHRSVRRLLPGRDALRSVARFISATWWNAKFRRSSLVTGPSCPRGLRRCAHCGARHECYRRLGARICRT